MRVGQARKRDYNEPEIVQALEDIGVTVYRLSGEGLPDLLTHFRAVWLPIEVKRPRGQLTPAQQKRQAVAPCPVVESITDALAIFGMAVTWRDDLTGPKRIYVPR